MADENEQAKAADTDTETAADHHDTAESQNGTTEISELELYREQIAKLKSGEIQAEHDDEQEQEQSADADEEQEQDETEQEQEEDNAEDEDADAEVKAQERFRFKSDEDKAIAMIAKARNCGLAQATKIYEGQAPARTEETQQESEETAQPASLAVAAELKDLQSRYKDAIRGIDVDVQADLFDEIEAKRDQLAELKATEARAKEASEQQRAHTENQSFQQKVEAAEKKTATMYPGFFKEEHPMFKESQRIAEEMRQNGDPLQNDPELYWHIAKEAARRTGTLMAQPKKESQAPKNGKNGSPANLASGNRGTTSVTSAQQAEKEIEGLTTQDSYKEYIERQRELLKR